MSVKSYWMTWAVLLALSLGMIVLDSTAVSRVIGLALVAAMLVKATLIGANFMHLRHERPGLVLSVAIGILATAAVLFFLLAADASRIRQLSGNGL